MSNAQKFRWGGAPVKPKPISQRGWGGAYGSGQDQAAFAANTPAGLAAAGQPQPAPPVTGGATPQPPDPSLELAKAQAGRNVALARGEGAYQQGNLNFDFGFNPDGSVNAANPYSRAALLMLNFQHQQNATTNQMANAGQLYSGAYGNQQGIDQSNYAQADAANRLAYQRATHGVQSSQLSTYANNSLGVGDSEFQALLKSVYPGG